MSAQIKAAINSYSDYGYNSEIEYADPHRLIQMLFEGAIKRIAFAKGAMERNEIMEKGAFISQTIDIVGGLRASLDMEKGGDIAQNLDSLYIYITQQLVQANLDNDESILDEVSGLLKDVKTAWDAISVPEVEANNETELADEVEGSIDQPVKTVSAENETTLKKGNSQTNRALKAYSV